MTDRELRRLGKTDLLMIIRDQEEENMRINAQLTEMREKLECKQVNLQECGSIAEAALKLNGIFQLAQEAADQYVASVKEREVASRIMAQQMEGAAARQVKDMIKDAEERCAVLEKESEAKVEDCWAKLKEKTGQQRKEHVNPKQFADCSEMIFAMPKVREG